ncbi:MAG: SMC family ATPase, partial [Chloroflexi bacterium]|nr:SMC family ATPase [Chloroflexota bacterium]
ELERKKTELRALEKELSQLETRLKQERDSIQSKDALLKKESAEAEEAAAKVDEERNKLNQIEQQLAGRDFAIAEQEALRELETEAAKLAYDPQQHEEIRNRLTALEQYEMPKRKLEEADRLFNEEKEALSRAEESVRELRQNLEADNQKIKALTTELTALPQLLNDLAQAENEAQAIATQQRQAQEILGTVKGKLERCRELEAKRKEKKELLSKASQEEKVYKDLAQAFGKRGIQALIIETALPEIEEEANRLLARMTDNRMHVKIETQRETKKGEAIETLDIKIADELGTRNYEMFSGGEAFRINFAIRIALSKLLARRAGAPLPTLIIDEGFGTQDSAGIEKLKEAINSIQDDFEKILVITHIDELKEAFPTRIDVTKTAEGSTISLN